MLASTGVAPGLRPIAAKNFRMIAKLAAPLHPPKWLPAALLSGAAAIEALAAVSYLRGALSDGRSDAGFALSLWLFGAFFLIDDAFDDYDLGAKHRAIFTLVAATYAASRVGES